MANKGLQVHISGIVQGVGFRPFVYELASQLALKGWVRNSAAGVDIEVDGEEEKLQRFVDRLATQAPPLAQIDDIAVSERSPNGFSDFQIVHSGGKEGDFLPISAEIAVCEDCLREVFSPDDRHHHYPFTNCTNCGPRFTIIQDIPYDRPQTTMAAFEMCADCAKEYEDPSDRRFHAQPVSCPACGPKVWLESDGRVVEDQNEALNTIHQHIAEGKIAAIKGLGGFHLACDAYNAQAVATLRCRKQRPLKPMAVMMASMAVVERHCHVSERERDLLTSREAPIVVLEQRAESRLAANLAPGQQTIGVMLPYTPLHHLLLKEAKGVPRAWVMTSGNLSGQAIIHDNESARADLDGIADAILMHDRPIHARCDDSVVRMPKSSGPASIMRRARGYAPTPIRLAEDFAPILASGAELKNTFCLTRERYAFVSPHIGDLQNYETLQAYEESIAHFQRLFRIQPQAIAHDLHPDYLATRYATARRGREGIRTIGVQHHYAHIMSCMAENRVAVDEQVIGLAFDGTGYGLDGAIWGGEVLIAGYGGFERKQHLRYVGLPGGDAAAKQPWRMALAWLREAGIEDHPIRPSGVEMDAIEAVKEQIGHGTNSSPTSSMGRLFDAVAALTGICYQNHYEAQAAIELENVVDEAEKGRYAFDMHEHDFSAAPVIRAIVEDMRAKVPLPKIAARFHNGLADVVRDLCVSVREETGLSVVALSGGVWQNLTLLSKSLARLEQAGFEVLTHQALPANDGGISFGQAVAAQHVLKG